MPIVIINNIVNLFFKTSISVLVISKHNSFRVLFDKIASVYILVEKYIHILALEMANPVNQRGPIGLHKVEMAARCPTTTEPCRPIYCYQKR